MPVSLLKKAPPWPGIPFMIRFLHILLLFCAIPAAPAGAEEVSATFTGKGLSVQLVSDATTIQPGQTFHLGLWLRHDPGYHTYWQNPGLAGVATKLVPSLPPGFTIGTLVYPPPDKVKMAGIRVHGYEHDVLIALPVTAPATLPAEPLPIPVDATWMACQRTCNPGFAKLSLTLGTGLTSTADPAWSPKFEALIKSQPPALQGWTLTATRLDKYIDLAATPPAGTALPDAPQFFSFDNLICSHPLQNWEKSPTAWRVRLELSDFLPKDQSQLCGLLFAKESWLPGQAAACVSITVPVKSEN
jgi:thiol:disulfide interchange protein DsbD